MGNKLTKALTCEQYKELTENIYNGFSDHSPNPRIATALVVEANTGLRIGDVVKLKPSSFVKTPTGYRFNIIEEKTGKLRTFPIQKQVYDFISEYIEQENIGNDEIIFPISVRAVQIHLQKLCDYLGKEYNNIGTHSFRKFFGTNVYFNCNCDIELVRRLYQHSSAAVTARYIGVSDQRIEEALNSVVNIPKNK